jgi:hypothetical protein
MALYNAHTRQGHLLLQFSKQPGIKWGLLYWSLQLLPERILYVNGVWLTAAARTQLRALCSWVPSQCWLAAGVSGGTGLPVGGRLELPLGPVDLTQSPGNTWNSGWWALGHLGETLLSWAPALHPSDTGLSPLRITKRYVPRRCIPRTRVKPAQDRGGLY